MWYITLSLWLIFLGVTHTNMEFIEIHNIFKVLYLIQSRINLTYIAMYWMDVVDNTSTFEISIKMIHTNNVASLPLSVFYEIKIKKITVVQFIMVAKKLSKLLELSIFWVNYLFLLTKITRNFIKLQFL